jgi:RNA polymerase sigma-70 factor, ECF subfamily
MDQPRTEAEQEREWVRLCQQGEREPFGHLVERHQHRMFSLVYHFVRRRDEVEDLVQEIFIKAFQGIRSYNFQSLFSTWLSRIAVNHCYDYLRRERSARVSYFWQMSEEGERELISKLEDGGPETLNSEEKVELKDLTTKLLQRAPRDDRIILTLKELEDMSVEEIAETLNLKPTTVKVRLHRARKRMVEDLTRLRSEG